MTTTFTIFITGSSGAALPIVSVRPGDDASLMDLIFGLLKDLKPLGGWTEQTN